MNDAPQQPVNSDFESTASGAALDIHQYPQQPSDFVVLVVDDQPQVLRTLARALTAQHYQVVTAASAVLAIEIFKQQPIHVVIADHHMPGMTGTELLQITARLSPHTVRIMLTGETGVTTLLPAVNSGAIDKLLTKPWSIDGLVAGIEEIARLRRLEIENSNLNEILRIRNEELRELNQHLESRIEDKARALIRAIHYDAATGLPKYSLITDRLDQILSYAHRVGQTVTIVMLGIDRLNIINNSIGYQSSNELLCAFADWLREEVSANDGLAKLEGDEFAVLLHGAQSQAKLDALQQHLNERLREPFIVNQREIYMTLSVGVSFFPQDASGVDELLQAAGWAMQNAREVGGDCWRYCTDQPNTLSRRRLSLEAELRNALKREEFTLYYQPRVDTGTGRLSGAEALVRWQHPERGLVMPDEFIPLLEQSTLINDLGDWVLMEACRAFKRWQDGGLRDFNLSVNISPVQIAAGNLLQGIDAALTCSQIDLNQGQLELEITEGTLVRNDISALDVLREIHDRGVQFAIDDFGTGYSSLSYLTRFPIDVLKIDRSFVTQINLQSEKLKDYSEGNALVQAIMNIAHGLRLATVAEGIENHRQWEFLHACGCNELQGYLFSKPIPENEFLRVAMQNLPLPTEPPHITPLSF